jgi:hypothetical protein
MTWNQNQGGGNQGGGERRMLKHPDPGKGILRLNDKTKGQGDPSKKPDFKGLINCDGHVMWLSIWHLPARQAQDGTMLAEGWSVGVQTYQEQQGQQQGQQAPQQPPQYNQPPQGHYSPPHGQGAPTGYVPDRGYTPQPHQPQQGQGYQGGAPNQPPQHGAPQVPGRQGGWGGRPQGGQPQGQQQNGLPFDEKIPF